MRLPLLLVASLALGTAALLAAASKGTKPQLISQGAPVKLESYAVAGKTTIFDFYSEFCPPCRAISPALEKLHTTRDDVVVVKVDINRPGIQGIDWKSPVAQQFKLQSIPHFKVYGPDGKLQAEGDAARGVVKKLLES